MPLRTSANLTGDEPKVPTAERLRRLRRDRHIRRYLGSVVVKRVGVPLCLPLGFLIALGVMLLWRVHRVRFHRVTALRIGHLLPTPDLMIRERQLGIGPLAEQGSVVFYANPPVSNYTVWRSHQRLLLTWPYPLAEATVRWLRIFGWSARCDVGAIGRVKDVHSVRSQTAPSVVLPRRVDVRGAALLRRLGLLNYPIACLQVRDSSYRPDYSYRDSLIESFAPAVEYLVSEGYVVVRMGSRTHRRLPLDSSRVIDLFHDGYTSDDIDMYFARNAEIWLSTGSGIDAAAWVYGAPMVFADFALMPSALGDYRGTQTLVLPRDVVDVASGKPVHLDELVRFTRSRDDVGMTKELPSGPDVILRGAHQLVRLARGEPLISWSRRDQNEFWRRTGTVFTGGSPVDSLRLEEGDGPCILEPVWLSSYLQTAEGE